jgi:hypothetical protein
LDFKIQVKRGRAWSPKLLLVGIKNPLPWPCSARATTFQRLPTSLNQSYSVFIVMPIGFLRCNQERSLHGNGKGAANGPILQNIQLQACINEDQFHFGTLYKTKLEIIENC